MIPLKVKVSFEDDQSESDTASATDDDVDVQITGVEVVCDGENSITDLCESTLERNYTPAESIVPEDSITLSETFLPTSCEFVPVDVEDIVFL